MWTRENDIELAEFIGWDNCTKPENAEQRLRLWAADQGNLFSSKDARLMLVREGWTRARNQSAALYKILIASEAFEREEMRGHWRLVDSPAPRFDTVEGSRLIMTALNTHGFKVTIESYGGYTVFIDNLLGSECFEYGEDMETPLAAATLRVFKSM